VTVAIQENQLAISAIAPRSAGLLFQLSKRVFETGCNLLEARSAPLGEEAGMLMLVSGSWDALARLEVVLSKLATENGVTLNVRRTQVEPLPGTHIAYLVELVAADRPGLLHQVLDFFLKRSVDAEIVTATRFKAQLTGTDMFNAQLQVAVPSAHSITALRDDFMDFCDHLNLDAIMDPIKS
jgi:glycine cleavage system transcriptional repressor